MKKNLLLEAANFTPASLEAPGAWCGHIPFASWLIRVFTPGIFVELGTHSGNSYFSFCQSVREANLVTKCYAVDTWQGDEHAGFYDDEIFFKVNRYNEDHYAGFSRLLKMKFGDGVSYFSDGSIDLLHIDGLHTYEAVKHDFETWLPKLAPGAIVLFHDTNVRERGFGVWKLWEELQARYPRNIEFLHSHGLGVLQLDGAEDTKEMIWLDPHSVEQQPLKNYFFALGKRQMEYFELVQTNIHVANLNEAVVERDARITHLSKAVAERDARITHLGKAVAERDARITHLGKAVAERDARITNLNRAMTERDAQIEHLKKDNFLRGEWALRIDRELKDAENLVAKIRTGNSWRITLPFREIRRWFTYPRIQFQKYAQMISETGRKFYLRTHLNEKTKMTHKCIMAEVASGSLREKNLYPMDRHAQNTNKVATFRNLAYFAFSNPRTVCNLMRPHMMKKAWMFLVNNSWNFQKFMRRSEELYFRQARKPKENLSEIILPLISRYHLPRSSGENMTTSPGSEEIDIWTKDLRMLAKGLPGENSAVKVSVVIPVHNQIKFTVACLHSIYANTGDINYEIIIADDNSTDMTPEIFKNDFPRVRYFRSKKNVGFLHNCNHAAQHALGQYIVLLNNDTLVYPGWLDELIRTMDQDASIGLVGSKLIFPEGILQEAGGIIFEDGNGWNYGRFCDAASPQFNYLRDVDYCSGASVAIPAKLWRQLDGFDTRFSPAYYEDTDLAFRVREAGYRVVYQPLSEVVHFEGISNGKSEHSGIKKYQTENQQKFYLKWKHVLAAYGNCYPEALPVDRNIKGRVLVVDATTPTPDKDSGSMDAYNYMMIMQNLGYHVTFVPENMVFFDEYTKDLQRKGVECVYLPWVSSLRKAVECYAPDADIVMLCRVNVAAPLIELVRRCAPRAKILFDTVDLHFLRETREAELFNSCKLADKAAGTRIVELEVIRQADATALRSTYEMELLKEIVPDARLLNFPIVRKVHGPSPVAWKDRRDVVFIGGFAHPPNADAVKYFVSEVWPILRDSGFLERFIIAGSNMPDEIAELAADDIIVHGFVEDLSDIFGKCRLSVAPLRYGAGMKGKVVTSLSYGVPCVATQIAAEGSGLVHNKNILVADDATKMAEMIRQLCNDQRLWEKLSQSGLSFCEEKFSIRATREIIGKAFAELLATGRENKACRQ